MRRVCKDSSTLFPGGVTRHLSCGNRRLAVLATRNLTGCGGDKSTRYWRNSDILEGWGETPVGGRTPISHGTAHRIVGRVKLCVPALPREQAWLLRAQRNNQARPHKAAC